MTEGKTIYAALLAIQQGIVVPKDKDGYGYKYRTADGILQAAKQLLKDNGVICVLSDKAEQVGSRHYVTATATLIDIATGDQITSTGTAVEPDKLASMTPPQITGTASTYARKRALEGLFLLDNEEDIDSREMQDNLRNAHQRPQQTAQQAKKQNAGQSASTYDEATIKAIRALNEEMNRIGLTNKEVAAIAGLKFGKTSTKEMSAGEINNLTANLEQWVLEESGVA